MDIIRDAYVFYAKQLLITARETQPSSTKRDKKKTITSATSSNPHRLCKLVNAYVQAQGFGGAYSCSCAPHSTSENDRFAALKRYPFANDRASKKAFEASSDAQCPCCFETDDDPTSDDGTGPAGRAGGISTVKALLFVMAHMCRGWTSTKPGDESATFTEAEAVEIVSAALRQQKALDSDRNGACKEAKQGSKPCGMWGKHEGKCGILDLRAYLQSESALSLSVSSRLYSAYRLGLFECVAADVGGGTIPPPNDRAPINSHDMRAQLYPSLGRPFKYCKATGARYPRILCTRAIVEAYIPPPPLFRLIVTAECRLHLPPPPLYAKANLAAPTHQLAS